MSQPTLWEAFLDHCNPWDFSPPLCSHCVNKLLPFPCPLVCEACYCYFAFKHICLSLMYLWVTVYMYVSVCLNECLHAYMHILSVYFLLGCTDLCFNICFCVSMCMCMSVYICVSVWLFYVCCVLYISACIFCVLCIDVLIFMPVAILYTYVYLHLCLYVSICICASMFICGVCGFVCTCVLE